MHVEMFFLITSHMHKNNKHYKIILFSKTFFSGTYCDPLEDKNVHAFLQNVTGTLKQDDIIIAASKVISIIFFLVMLP